MAGREAPARAGASKARPEPVATCVHCQQPFGFSEGTITKEVAVCDICNGISRRALGLRSNQTTGISSGPHQGLCPRILSHLPRNPRRLSIGMRVMRPTLMASISPLAISS